MSTAFNLLFGLLLLGAGSFRRRRVAMACGSVLLALALLDVALIYAAVQQGRAIPAIGLHSVFLFPLAVWLAWRGARDLSSKERDAAAK